MQITGRHSISVVTPVYNGEASIAELCRRLGEVLPQIATEYEIIFVNDDSRDRSWEIISELSSRLETVRGLNLMRNYGQHNALLCGIRAAKYDVVVTMDDDLQHPPEEIPRLLTQLVDGIDVVYGTPKAGRHSALARSCVSHHPTGPEYGDWKRTIKERERFPTSFARICARRLRITNLHSFPSMCCLHGGRLAFALSLSISSRVIPAPQLILLRSCYASRST